MKYLPERSTAEFTYPPTDIEAPPSTWATWAAQVYVTASEEGRQDALVANLSAVVTIACEVGHASAALGIVAILSQIVEAE